jgi:signal transduction histidine kinase
MSLKRVKLWARQVGVKMTLWYLFFFGVSSVALFAVTYVLFSRSLTVKDHEVLSARAQEYSLIYRGGGIEGLKAYLGMEGPSKEVSNFFIRVVNSERQNIFSHFPKTIGVKEMQEMETQLQNAHLESTWIYVHTPGDWDDIEVVSTKVGDGSFLLIGKTVDDRYDLLGRLNDVFFIIFFIALVLGGIGGLLLSSRTLRPLKELVTTIRSVNQGDENARVPMRSTGDELEDLTRVFNQMLDRIQFSNQAMRQTLDTVAHELRTPLTSVRGMAEVALSHNSTSEYRDVLENCVEGIDEIISEFKLMTDITEMETGLKSLRKEKIQLRSLCAEVLDLYEIVAEQKNIAVSLQSGPEVFLAGDRKKLKQVVANLVDNAIKYSPSGSEVKVRCIQGAKQAIITVEDQGIGISENELPHIWKRLYRGEKSRDEKGLGLGLSLVKSIVEAHEGSIDVKSEPDHGTHFQVRLPQI